MLHTVMLEDARNKWRSCVRSLRCLCYHQSDSSTLVSIHQKVLYFMARPELEDSLRQSRC